MRSTVLSLILAGAATAVLMLAFNYLQGYHQPRLQVGLLLVPIIVSLRQVDVAGLRNGMSWLAFAISIAQFAAGFTGPAISQT